MLLGIDPDSAASIHEQIRDSIVPIYQQIRNRIVEAIAAGELPAGSGLPATQRRLAADPLPADSGRLVGARTALTVARRLPGSERRGRFAGRISGTGALAHVLGRKHWASWAAWGRSWSRLARRLSPSSAGQLTEPAISVPSWLVTGCCNCSGPARKFPMPGSRRLAGLPALVYLSFPPRVTAPRVVSLSLPR